MKAERTYGGEVETLAVDLRTGYLKKVEKDTLVELERGLQVKGKHGNTAAMGYYSSYHLLESNLPVCDSLPDLVSSAQEVTSVLNEGLSKIGTGLLSSSHHPTDDIQSSWRNGVLAKPIYDLLSGKRAPHFELHPDVLPKVYPTNPDIGRGWNHPIGTMSASIQAWNSLDFAKAPEQIAVLQTTGFMLNLLTANSPFVESVTTGLRDSRMRMWQKGGMIDTSRYASERVLSRNLPEKPSGYADYFRFVLGNQRPFVVPMSEKDTSISSGTVYKTKFMAVVQPGDNEQFSTLDMLKMDSFPCVDFKTGEIAQLKPKLSQIFNGFDFLYFPGNGARFRCNLPDADKIDPKAFALAIENRDEITLRKMLQEGGIEKGGFVCAEGRVSATVLPTADHPEWDRFNMSFVLQTALVRAHEPVMELLNRSGLTWSDLTVTLPKLTNQTEYGFNTVLKGVSARQLASKIWQIAKMRLTKEEEMLVGDQIDKILSTRMAPAEEQIRYVRESLDAGNSRTESLENLIKRQIMVRI